MPCSDERLRPPKSESLDHPAHRESSDRAVRNAQGSDDHAAPKMCYLVIEAHQLCVGLLRHRSVDKAAIDEVFNAGQGPGSFDAEFRLGNLRENEIVGPENAPRRQCSNSRASTPSHPKIFSNGLRRSRSSAATSRTQTTVVWLSTHRIHSSNAAFSRSDCSSVVCVI